MRTNNAVYQRKLALSALLLSLLLSTTAIGTQSLRSGATFAGIDGTCRFEKPGDPDWLFQRFNCVVPYSECANYIDDWRTRTSGALLYYYISGTDMPAYKSLSSTTYNSGLKSAWIRERIEALGGIEEEAYMHFYNDTRIRNWNGSSWDTMLIPGTQSMTIQPKDSVSRVPNGYVAYLFNGGNTYTYPTRLSPNFASTRLRQAYKEYITHIFSPEGDVYWPNRTGYWDGVYFDNYNHTNLKGSGLVSGGLVVESGTNPSNLLTYGTDTYADWGWNWMLQFGRDVRDTLRTSDQWSIDHKHKMLSYNFGNYHKTILENPDSSGCDMVHYEFAWDPVYCNNVSTHRLENLHARDSLAASRGVSYFWSSIPRTSYGGQGTTGPKQAIYNNLCFYLVARSDSTWIFMRPTSGNAYGAFLNGGFDTTAWIPAMEYELGWPAQHYQLAQSGSSPDQPGSAYKVWVRQFPYGKVYSRPRDGFEALWGDASTAVTIDLGGSYRKLLIDGTLGPVVTQIALRGAEGAIMIPATTGECTEPPTVPTANSPASGATVASVTPLLCINSSTQSNCSQPIRYHFQIAAQSSFTTITQENSAVGHSAGTSCWQLPVALSPGTTYYWRVRAGNGASWSGWSAARSFATPNNAPGTPTLVSPGNGATLNTRQPNLTISNSTDPEGTILTYNFQVSGSSTFGSIVAQVSGVVQGGSGQTSWQVSSQLNNFATYYWRVRASDGVNNSGWSATRSFVVNASTANTAPTTPTVNVPGNGSSVGTTTPLLRVNNSTDAEGNSLTYQFEVFDSTMSTLVMASPMIASGSGTTAWTASSDLTNNVRYQWRARAYDGLAWSNYMAAAEFRVVLQANSPPSTPVPLTPGGGQIVYGTPVTLMTNNAYDFEGDGLFYSFRVFSDSLMTKQVEISNGRPENDPYTSYQTNGSYLHNKPYWWTVRAFDGSAYSDWAAPLKFIHYDMALDTEDAATLLYPTDGAVVRSTHPTFRIGWVGVSDTVACSFELAKDRQFIDLVDAGVVVGTHGSAEWSARRELTNGVTYFWRAKLASGGYSALAEFSISSPIFVSPNPFSYLDGEMTFHNLPAGSRIEVFTPSGDRVVTIDDLSGEFRWDVRNPSGEKLAPGVFLYYVRFEGQTLADKFIIVR